jgi:hypothetical protein
MGGHSNEDNTIRQDIGEPSDTVSGKSVVPTTAFNGQKFALSGWMDERKKVVSTSRPTAGIRGSVGCLVDMKTSSGRTTIPFSKSTLATVL